MSERRRLPTERRSITHKFQVGGQEGYMIVGLYDDGTPGELFLFVAKPPVQEARVDREVLGREVRRIWNVFAAEQGLDATRIITWEGLSEILREGDRLIGERMFKLGATSSVDESGWSMLRGFTDAVAVATSMLLQHGVPLSKIAAKYVSTRFEPSGQTGNSEIRIATSILDYVFRWMLRKFEPEVLAT